MASWQPAEASGKALDAIKKTVPFMFGGSADLASSNEMDKQGSDSFQPMHPANSNIWWGVREHAMGGAMNGIAHHGGLRTYGGTFLTFSDYMRGAIRLTALAESTATFVFTHDSIGLGEDGPTHQPIEQVLALRSIPNIVVLRPAGANESTEAWRIAMTTSKSPVVLVFLAPEATHPGPVQARLGARGRGQGRVHPERSRRRHAAAHSYRHRLGSEAGDGRAERSCKKPARPPA
ncbi:MAG: hypothetical protein WKG07_49970 [Hymenobacter sp.]